VAKKLSNTDWVKSLQPRRLNVLELNDSERTYLPTSFLSQHVNARNEDPVVAKLVHQFLKINRPYLNELDVQAQLSYSGDDIKLNLKSKTKIGAVPLLSPITHKNEYSLVIKPRFGWKGVGPILSRTGFRYLPHILELPQLRISETHIPPWVLSSVILSRIENLINKLNRRFEMTTQVHPIPKGSVDWSDYAQKRVPNAQFLNFDCTYSDLRDNRLVKSFIKYTLLKQKQSLETQRDFGIFVIQLIDYCDFLLQNVYDTSPVKPTPLQLSKLLSQSFEGDTLTKGIQAIKWTNEEKGLAGIGDLHGLPLSMNMEVLFESYLESVISRISEKIGGVIKSGRLRETIIPIDWDPPLIGSQRSLVPDIIFTRNDDLFIIDAKYKDHWEDLNIKNWNNLEDVIKERHRNDLLQILAYTTGVNQKNISCCLVYPCKKETWRSLLKRNRHIHKAEINRGNKRINVFLTAVPLDLDEENIEKLLPIFLN
jgi:hypothetical protein